jgi:hypothetical protein
VVKLNIINLEAWQIYKKRGNSGLILPLKIDAKIISNASN